VSGSARTRCLVRVTQDRPPRDLPPAFYFPPHILPLFQVKTSQGDLKLQTVWDNIWGVVQVVFLADGKVLTVHKPGELHVYNSVEAKSQVRDKIEAAR